MQSSLKSKIRLHVCGEASEVMVHPKVGDVETLDFLSAETGEKLGTMRTRRNAEGRICDQTFVPPSGATA